MIPPGAAMILRMKTQAHPQVPLATARSFVALMDLYEMNYMLMRRLMPKMQQQRGVLVSTCQAGLPLHVEVLEQDRFTTVLRLFYRIRQDEGRISEVPDLHVRVYHDARVAEAVAGRLRGRDCVVGGRSGERCLDVRWRLNRFLNKWLRFLLHRKHLLE